MQKNTPTGRLPKLNWRSELKSNYRVHTVIETDFLSFRMNKKITNIVFTKNRPLQLEGYLRSLYKYFPQSLMQTVIIYKRELFEQEYDSVFSKFSNIKVLTEQDFHSDLLNVLAEAKTEYILFGVDDVVFFDGLDFSVIDNTFRQAGDDIFGFTLRFGLESAEISNDEITFEQAGDQTVCKIDWSKGQSVHSRYPFELCCTFYRTAMVKQILNELMSSNIIAKKLFKPDSVLVKTLWKIGSSRSLLKKFGYFFSPNTLESWPCKWCQRNSDKLPHFTYFQKLCVSAIQVNMVNTSTLNTFDGTLDQTVEKLNEKYKQGFRLDIDYVNKNKPSSMSCGHDYFRLVKNQI